MPVFSSHSTQTNGKRKGDHKDSSRKKKKRKKSRKARDIGEPTVSLISLETQRRKLVRDGKNKRRVSSYASRAKVKLPLAYTEQGVVHRLPNWWGYHPNLRIPKERATKTVPFPLSLLKTNDQSLRKSSQTATGTPNSSMAVGQHPSSQTAAATIPTLFTDKVMNNEQPWMKCHKPLVNVCENFCSSLDNAWYVSVCLYV